jgi:AraC-like DNA-binding protein
LLPYVRRYADYAVETGLPRAHESPTAGVTLIVNLGETLWAGGRGDPVAAYPDGLIVGLHESYIASEIPGGAVGVQIDLSAIGAARMLGVPVSCFANKLAGATEVLGSGLADLADRMRAAQSWPARFAALDTYLLRRLGNRPERVPPVLQFAWHELTASVGSAPIGELAARAGCSRQHLTALFVKHLGLPPKQVARLIRFEHASMLLRDHLGDSIAEVATMAGYYDQPHLTREFRLMAGVSPAEIWRGYIRTRPPAGMDVASTA